MLFSTLQGKKKYKYLNLFAKNDVSSFQTPAQYPVNSINWTASDVQGIRDFRFGHCRPKLSQSDRLVDAVTFDTRPASLIISEDVRPSKPTLAPLVIVIHQHISSSGVEEGLLAPLQIKFPELRTMLEHLGDNLAMGFQ